ncbi:histone-lysine N-methyltransferase Su(var)3-9-like [Brevipalpus obovatus]|uniref:histone-lysine N-methyltransferase Su(var)3-9-like n=1 Tax=Brevipalpus obovatus TaxID=246614 RepID=UPI003D9F23FB
MNEDVMVVENGYEPDVCDHVEMTVVAEEVSVEDMLLDQRAGNNCETSDFPQQDCIIDCLESIESLHQKCVDLGIHATFDCETIPKKRNNRRKNNHYYNNRRQKKTNKQQNGVQLAKKVEVEEEMEEEEVYEVEKIVDYKITDDIYYFVKWKDWDPSTNTWEPRENLNSCDEILAEFELENHMNEIYDNPMRSLASLIHLLDRVTADKYSDAAVLLKLCDIPIDSYHGKKSEIQQMKKRIKEKNVILKEALSSDNGNPKVPHQALINYILRELHVFKNFGNLGKFEDFFDNRKQVVSRLKAWENQLNEQIKRETKACVPLAVENLVDLEGPPDNFTYITSCKVDPSVIFVDDDPPLWCNCTNCFDNRTQCCPLKNEVRFAYNKFGTLVIPQGSPIYECNKKCKCPYDCPNRVIQKGRQHKVAIFRTDNGCGWGVKALEPILKGRFVMEYVGELITVSEADRRGKGYDEEGRLYLFDLDFSEDGECQYTIDASYYGDISHFVNHSCDPNLEVYAAWIDTLNPKLQRIAFFSRRNIRLGEQLTFDYRAAYGHNEPLTNGVVNKPKPIIPDNLPKVIVESLELDTSLISLEARTTLSSEVVSEGDLPNGHMCPSLSNGSIASEEMDESDKALRNNITLESGISSSSSPSIIQDSVPIAIPSEVASTSSSCTLPSIDPPEPFSFLTSKRIACKCGALECRKFLF